ncbi:MBL fold metallo-hydrolase [Vallitalea okinawensis]|uniref:MBL fold metallo-hydrolase n=1 Tax=Vallitalea okinawensis TaxID=2078660 RepID=UPI000CFC8C37|nr:MBL fold metallo-hydrolase [Vallitalea okinawensis]
MREWFTIDKVDEKTYIISEYAHWERAHSYLLIGDKEAALIDTGLGIGNIKEVVDKLTSLPVVVLTTHAHWDHMGGHNFFEQIFVHHKDVKWIEQGLPISLEVIRNHVIRGMKNNDLPVGFKIENYHIFKGQVSGRLKDDDVIDIGNRFVRVIHTPGHSPGHVCYYEDKTGYLFSGDLLYKGTLFAYYPSTDPKLFYQSVDKLTKLNGISRILPAHNDLDIKVDLIDNVLEGFKEIDDLGLLNHGSGEFDYGEFAIKI